MAKGATQEANLKGIPMTGRKISGKRRTGWIWVTKAAVSAGLFLWIIASARPTDVLTALARADIGWLLLAACSPALGIVLTATRWGGLLRAQGVAARQATLIQSCFVAGFFRQFLPSTIGGDAIRGYDSWRAGASKSGAVAALLVDRILGMLVLILFAAAAVCLPQPLTGEHPSVLAAVVLATAAMLLGTWFLFLAPRKLVALARRFIARMPAALQRPAAGVLDAVTAYRGKLRQLPRALGYSVLLQINVITFYYLLGRAMGFAISYPQYCVIVPIATFVMLVPVSINAIGVREGVFVFLLGSFGISNADAVAFAWLEHGLFLLYGLFGAVVFAWRKAPRHISSKPTVVSPCEGGVP